MTAPIKNSRLGLCVLSNLLFLLIYFTLAYYNRIAHDDFYSLFMVREYGVIDGAIFQYNNWGTRYFGTSLNFLIALIPTYPLNNFIVNSALLALSVFGIYRVLILSDLLNKHSIFSTISYSLFIFSAIFYSSIHIGETWFWHSAISYTLSVIVFTIGSSFIASRNSSISHYFLLGICFFLVGGLNELLSLIAIGLGLCLLIFRNILSLSKSQTIKLIVAISATTIAFLILILGPGNSVRESFFRDMTLLESLIPNAHRTKIILRDCLIPSLPAMLLWSVTSITLFSKQSANKWSSPIMKFILSLIGLGIFIYLFQLPITYKTQDIAAIRALFPLTVILFLFSAYWAYQLFIRNEIISKLAPFLLFCCISFQAYHMFTQKPMVASYAKAYDERMKKIDELKDEGKTIWLAPLPKSGWLYSAEISEDPNHFTNTHLQKGLDLNCKVALKKQEN